MDSTLYKRVGDLSRKWKHYPNVVDKTDPDNQKILIEKNARLAVDTALKYRCLGLSDDELISASFEGLAVAYQKYSPERSELRDKLLAAITDDTDSEEFLALVENHIKYGDVCKLFKNGVPSNPTEMRSWVAKHIRPAKFSSVAYFWCKAMVLSEIERVAKPLRVAESYRVENQFTSIDEGDVHLYNKITYEETDPEEVEENYSKLYEGVPDYCLNILFMRHGVGFDQPMTLREIADLHGRTVSDIKQILSDVTERITSNIRRYKLKISDLLG